MCIIVAKPKGVQYPSDEVLYHCWCQNPDGAGIMYNDAVSHRVKITKGFMEWGDFKAKYDKLKHVLGEDVSMVLHFRIKTHGEVSRECCHPFPLSNNLKKLRKTTTTATVGIAHNGIISAMATNKLTSDTMAYVMDVLYPLSKLADNFESDAKCRSIMNSTLDGSRLCIMKADGSLTLLGDWTTDNGVSYSNTYYKAFRSTAHVISAAYPYDTPKYLPQSGVEVPGDYGMPYGEYDEGEWGQVYNDYIDFLDEQPFESCDVCPLYNECVKTQNWLCLTEPFDACSMCPLYDDCSRDKVWACANDNDAADFVASMKIVEKENEQQSERTLQEEEGE